MVGRDAERQRLARFLAAGKHGHAVCLISGDAGIGKSSLLAATRAAAARRGFTVLAASPDESETALPFAALGDLAEPVQADLSAELPAFLRAVRAASRRNPVLIALDDVQWLDNSSWRAIRFALRRLDGHRVAVAAVVRGTEESERARAVVRSARGRVERLRLAPLPDDALEELLRSRDLLPAARAVRNWLLETAAGNPYFALELGAWLDAAPPGAATLPPVLAAALRDQLASAPPLAVRALVVAALESRARRELVVGMLGRGGTAAVDDAIARGLLRDDGVRGLRPAHPLLGAAALELTQPATIRRLRRRLARDAPDPVARAFHLAHATVTADPDAAAAIETAARGAQRRGALSEAAQLYAHAARLTPARDGDDRNKRSIASVDLRTAAGETSEAIDELERLAGLLEHGPLRAAVLGRLGALRYRVDRMDVAIDTFRAALEDAGDDAVRVELLRRLSLATMMSGDLGGAAEIAAEASAVAGRSPETRAFAAMVQAVMGRPGAAKRAAAARPPDASGLEVPAEMRATTIRALASSVLTGSERAAAEFGALLRRAERDGDLASLPYLLANLCEAQIACGDWGGADAVAARAPALLDDEPDALSAFLFAALARLAACRGRLADAERLGSRGLDLALRGGVVPAIHYNAAALGFLELTRGRYRAVGSHLGELVGGMTAVGLGEPQFARFVPDQVESLIRLGSLDAARATLAWWEDRGRLLERPFALATAARCRALLHAAEGDRVAAEHALAAAAEHHTDLGEPFEQARTDLVATEVHRRARRRGRASEAASAAADVFEMLGAPVWARKVDEERARLGTRRARGDTRLTETEQRIAALVAAGRTNREIAQTIFVASSTVEAALWRIYRKLDLRSRTELTRWHLDAQDAPPRPAGRGGASPPG